MATDRDVPIATGPAGQIFAAYGRAPGQRVGAVGLGIGAAVLGEALGYRFSGETGP